MHNVADTAFSPVRIALTCLGTFTVVASGRLVAHFPTDKVRALLAYLALQPGPHRRDALAGLLWPNIGQDYALKNLRNTLHRLRQALEQAAPGVGDGLDGLFAVTRQTIELNRAALDVDAMRFEALITECERHQHDDIVACTDCLARLAQAADLYRGELLTGFGLADAPAFEEWLLVRRESLHHHMLLCLRTLVEAHEQRDDFPQALTYANRQIALDPYREDAHRQVMRLLARLGQPHHALAHYDAVHRLLREELGAAPDAATVALYEAIRAGKCSDKVTGRQRDRDATNPDASIENRRSKIENRSGVPDPGTLFGREAELAEVTTWLTHHHTRVVAVLGLGGVGKTTLAASAARAVTGQFDGVMWQSLLNAPPLSEVLQAWLQALSGQSLTSLPPTLEAQLALLLENLRRKRCLLVLDNMESILQPDQPGRVLPGYEGYDQLVQRVADFEHHSCLILTSRERPQALTRREGDAPLVRTLMLEGLDTSAGRAMLAARGLSGSESDIAALIRRYSGNPLALKLVAQTIRELFAGDVVAFLSIEAPIFDDIRAVLDQQFARLLPLEREVMFWLAIERGPIPVQALRENLIHPPSSNVFIEALRALQRRSLIVHTMQGLSLQNVITEYVTDNLVEQVCQEIYDLRFAIDDSQMTNRQSKIVGCKLNRFALLKATARETVRASQVRLILQPVADRLVAALGRERLIETLKRLTASLQAQNQPAVGYAAGNAVNLLLHLGEDLSGYDFSRLNVWQAYLQDQFLPGVNFRGANLARSVFTHVFGEILAVQFSDDGQLLVAGVYEGRLRVWSATGGQSLREHQMLAAGGTIASFSPDGRLLASGHTDHSARLWDVATGRLLHRLEKHTETPWCLVFSWDGERVATTGADGSVNVWDVRTGDLWRSLPGHTVSVPALAFTHDGQILASGDVNGMVCLWDLGQPDSHEPIRTLCGHSEEVHSLAFDASGAVLASGSHDHTVRLWDVASGETAHVLAAHAHAIRTMVISPDGRTLASGGFDTFVCTWDVATGRALHTFLNLGHASASLAFSADGQMIAAAAVEQVVSLLDLTKGEQVDALHAYSNRLYSIDFSLDGHTLASGGTDGVVRLWDLRSTQSTPSTPSAGQALSTLSLSKGEGLNTSARDAGRVVQTLQGHTGWVRSVATSPRGETLASASDDGTIRLWDMGGHLLTSLLGHSDRVESIAFNPDARLLVSASTDATLRVWDVRSGKSLHVLKGHDARIYVCDFSPDGRLVASGSADRTVRVWDAHTGEALLVLCGHTNGVKCVAFSPDGRLLASGGFDHTVHFWDLRSTQSTLSVDEGLNTLNKGLRRAGRELATLRPQAASIVSLTFSVGGELLAFAAADHTVRIVDVQTGQVIHTLHGHNSSVECVCFRPDGRVLASAGMNETIMLWDVATGLCLHTLRAPGPYAGMNITGVTGISPAQKAALRALGAVEEI